MSEEIKKKLEAIASNDDIDLLWNEANDLLNYITNLQKENEQFRTELNGYKSRNEKAIEYVEKDTRWFDSEYAKIYGMLCDCEGAKGDRLEVLVNPTNLLNILQSGDEQMDKKDIIREIIEKVHEQDCLLKYQQIEDFLKLLNDDVLKQLYIYFCLDF